MSETSPAITASAKSDIAVASVPVPEAFFSYVQADDDHDQGYLTNFRRALSAEISAQLGQDFVIFQDRMDILWGQRWKQRIESSIDSATVLIAVVTPRFLKSDACREEVLRFREREARLGRNDLIFPLYYISVARWGKGSEDELVRDMASRQYSDWRTFRFEPLDRSDARRQIAHLASQIVASISLEAPPSKSVVLEQSHEGFVELMAEMEATMPLFTQTLVDFSSELTRVGEIVSSRQQDLEAATHSPKPSVARLKVIAEVAKALEAPTQLMEELSANYEDQLARVDGAVRAMIEGIPELSGEDVEKAEEVLGSLDELSNQADEGLQALQEFRKVLHTLSNLSSTIRPVLNRMDQAVASMLPSRSTFASWLTGWKAALEVHHSD